MSGPEVDVNEARLNGGAVPATEKFKRAGAGTAGESLPAVRQAWSQTLRPWVAGGKVDREGDLPDTKSRECGRQWARLRGTLET